MHRPDGMGAASSEHQEGLYILPPPLSMRNDHEPPRANIPQITILAPCSDTKLIFAFAVNVFQVPIATGHLAGLLIHETR